MTYLAWLFPKKSKWIDIGMFESGGNYSLIQMRFVIADNRKEFRKAKGDMIEIKRKDLTVNLDVNPAFTQAVPVLITAWAMLGLECVVTSGKDGVHSKNSAHYTGNALDLRIWDIAKHMTPMAFGYNLATALKLVCGDGFYVVLENDHFHVEYTQAVPNIKGWVKGKLFYDGLEKVA